MFKLYKIFNYYGNLKNIISLLVFFTNDIFKLSELYLSYYHDPIIYTVNKYITINN